MDLEVATAGERAVDDRVLEHDRVSARAAIASDATSRPFTCAEPEVGRTVVVNMPTVVDLPAPFGPSSPKTSPVATSKSMPRTASTPPAQVLVRARTLIAGWLLGSVSMPVTTTWATET